MFVLGIPECVVLIKLLSQYVCRLFGNKQAAEELKKDEAEAKALKEAEKKAEKAANGESILDVTSCLSYWILSLTVCFIDSTQRQRRRNWQRKRRKPKQKQMQHQRKKRLPRLLVSLIHRILKLSI